MLSAALSGVLVGLIGIVLALATIGAHRAHSATLITRAEANDKWRSTRRRRHARTCRTWALRTADALGGPARVQPVIEKFRADEQRYQHAAEDLNREARALEDEVRHMEGRALWLDLSEGFLELGLVLSSLYFLANGASFPCLAASAPWRAWDL